MLKQIKPDKPSDTVKCPNCNAKQYQFEVHHCYEFRCECLGCKQVWFTKPCT